MSYVSYLFSSVITVSIVAFKRRPEESGNAICVLCCLTHHKENWQLDLSSRAERIQIFFGTLRVPAKWMHFNGEVTHSRVGGEGRETGKYCAAEEKKICICSWLSLWNYHRMPWPLFSALPTETSELKWLKQCMVKWNGAERGKDAGIAPVISVDL